MVITMAMQIYACYKLDGIVCGRLPFEPQPWVTGMTHRGLNGDDNQQCGVFFIMMCVNGLMRNIIPKIMGFESPRLPMEQQAPAWAKSALAAGK